MDASLMIAAMSTDEEVLELVDRITEQVSGVQDQALEHILKTSSGISYFERHGLFGLPSKQEFRRLMPITTYDDIESYVQRIADGDESRTICSRLVNEMLSSSGTSGGRQKLFPKSPTYDQEFVVLNRVARAALNKQSPQSLHGKSLQFIYVRKPGMTSGGVITTSGLSGYFTSPAFRNRTKDPNTGYTSPDEVILCMDYQQASYCHLLCGLAQQEQVTSVGAVFASTFIRSMKTVQDCWRELCEDLRSGRVNSGIVSDFAVKDAVNSILKPNPRLAEMIRRECSRKNWRGIIRRLWPNAKLVQSIVTGSMQQYVPLIDFLSDGLPIASSLYASSESSTLGVNLTPLCSPSKVRYTVFPCFAYYEFLPVSKAGSSASADDLVELADVELGEEYELVITTRAGLYRYRVGDVLKVMSFHNNAPQFSFRRRAGVLLSVDTDKTDELELHTAVNRAVTSVLLRNHRDVHLVDYTSRVELSSSHPGHYVLYWELSCASVDAGEFSPELLRECCSVVEKSLSVVYVRNRREGTIGPLEIKLVNPGTFDRIVDHVAFRGQGSIGQYKTPRCAKDPAIVTILESQVNSVIRAAGKSF